MTCEEALAYIHSHKRLASTLTLDRMRRLMVLLGNPHKRLRTVHIAGTNGKGSTAAMTAAALTAAGYRTGLMISPFVVEFRERMQIGGVYISPQALAEEVERIRPLAEQIEGMNEFELVTAIGFDWFAREGCEILVAEVGLGGRFDATNVIEDPLVCVVTQIGLDHTELLGDTTAKIAFEKAGIIKPGAHVVTCPEQDLDALSVLLERCMEEGAVLEQPNLNGAEVLRMDLDGTDLRYQGTALHLPLLGRHQVGNALTAFTVCQWLSAHGYERLGQKENLERGFASVSFPGRMELFGRSPVVLVDGAHNESGAQALARGLSLLEGRPVTAVMGMLADKDSGGALEALLPHFSRVFCVTPDSPRALSAQALADAVNGFHGPTAENTPFGMSCDAVEEGLSKALSIAGRESGAVVVCGSLYLASEARRVLLQRK